MQGLSAAAWQQPPTACPSLGRQLLLPEPLPQLLLLPLLPLVFLHLPTLPPLLPHRLLLPRLLLLLPPHLLLVAGCGAAILAVLWFELVKWVLGRRETAQRALRVQTAQPA